MTDMAKVSIKNNEGVVLVMVLLVLIATIIIAVFVTRSSTTETKIAGNERIYKQNYYAAESGADYAMANNSPALAWLGINVGSTYQYATTTLPTTISNTAVTVRLTSITKPKPGTGFSVNDFRFRNYQIVSTDSGQAVEIGAWKAFPKAQ
jgi:Tfp pilus assembly protein PilX